MSIFKKNICVEYTQDVFRNICTINPSQHLFDDLSDDPLNWDAANTIDICTHPSLQNAGIIQRGFDYSINEVMERPFEKITDSRFSDGSFACWYGSEKWETTVHETKFHFNRRIFDTWEMSQTQEKIISDMCVWQVHCKGLALDLSDKVQKFPWLIDSDNYTHCQNVGRRITQEGSFLLRAASARQLDGINLIVFKQHLLSNPRVYCQLQYIFDVNTREISVKRGKKSLEC